MCVLLSATSSAGVPSQTIRTGSVAGVVSSALVDEFVGLGEARVERAVFGFTQFVT